VVALGWRGLPVLPGLAHGYVALPDGAARAGRGAPLTGAARLVWQHPGGPAAGIGELGAALAAG
jgi:hypothetical protein